MKRKRDIDRTAAEITSVPPYVVKMVTTAWIEAIRATLLEDGAVHLDLLGTLLVHTDPPCRQALPRRSFGRKVVPGKTVDVPAKIRVVFRKAKQLKLILKQRHDQGETSARPKRK